MARGKGRGEMGGLIPVCLEMMALSHTPEYFFFNLLCFGRAIVGLLYSERRAKGEMPVEFYQHQCRLDHDRNPSSPQTGFTFCVYRILVSKGDVHVGMYKA